MSGILGLCTCIIYQQHIPGVARANISMKHYRSYSKKDKWKGGKKEWGGGGGGGGKERGKEGRNK